MKPETLKALSAACAAAGDNLQARAELLKAVTPYIGQAMAAREILATMPALPRYLLDTPAAQVSAMSRIQSTVSNLALDLARTAQYFKELQERDDKIAEALARFGGFPGLQAADKWIAQSDAMFRRAMVAEEKSQKEMAKRAAWLDGISESVSQAQREAFRRFERHLTHYLKHLPRSLADRVRGSVPVRALPRTRNGLRAFLADFVTKAGREALALPPGVRRAAQADCARALAWLEGIQKRIERAAVRLLMAALSAFTHPAGERGGDGSTLPDLLSHWRANEQRGPPALVGDLMTTRLNGNRGAFEWPREVTA